MATKTIKVGPQGHPRPASPPSSPSCFAGVVALIIDHADHEATEPPYGKPVVVTTHVKGWDPGGPRRLKANIAQDAESQGVETGRESRRVSP